MLDQEQLNQKLDASPSSYRLTPDLLRSKVARTEFHKLSATLTVCVLTAANGFQIVGKSACADPANYNQEIGEKVAYDDAFRQLWALEGYLLRERIEALPKNRHGAPDFEAAAAAAAGIPPCEGITLAENGAIPVTDEIKATDAAKAA